MANVPEIQTFINAINAAVDALIQIRADLEATDRLWAIFNATAITSIRAAENTKLIAAKALVATLVVP